MRKETSVAIVLVVVVVLALTFVVVARPFGGISYITAQAERSSYSIGEDITFKLVSETQFAHFRGEGTSYDSGVYINKIPEGMTVDEFLENASEASNYIWPVLPYSPQVKFSNFNGDSAPLLLRWDGTYTGENMVGDPITFYATSGYYFLYPKVFVTQGDYVQAKIDRGSVFYLDSLNVSTTLSYDHSTRNLSLDLSISGLETGSHVLNASMMYVDLLEEQPYSNQTLYGSYISYLNQTFSLGSGEEWNGTLSVVLRTDDLKAVEGVFGEVVVGEKRYGFGHYYAVEENGQLRVFSSL